MDISPPGGQRHFAFAKVGKMLYVGWNSRKTNPRLARVRPNGATVACYHAETHVLLQIPESKRKKAKIYVMRVKRGGRLTFSKPCDHCLKTLISSGILVKNIYFTDSHGKWKQHPPTRENKWKNQQ